MKLPLLFNPDRPIRHVVSVSGGKDSTATYLMALEQTGGDFDAIFADTGNEHPATLEYIAQLHERTGGPAVKFYKADFSKTLARKREYLASGKAASRSVNPWAEERVQKVLAANWNASGIPFLDLCRAKGIFPSNRRAFCSQRLKRLVLHEQGQQSLIEDGFHIVSWQGIRAEESVKRSCLSMWESSPDNEFVTIYRPIIGWTVADLAAMYRHHGLLLNPLYGMGFQRVGCMPCMNSGKQDLRLIEKKCPDMIDKIRNWERIVRCVSRKGASTFFHQDTTGNDTPASIDEVVRWARTRRGGRQFDLFALLEATTSDVCVYAGGLCE